MWRRGTGRIRVVVNQHPKASGVVVFVALAVGLVTAAVLRIDPIEWRLMSAAERADASVLKQLGMTFKIYTNENKDLFPPATAAPEFGLPDVVALKAYMWPELAERITSKTKPRICYLGYLLVDEAPARALFDAWQKAGAPLNMRNDVALDPNEDYGPYSTDTKVFRLKEGSERFFIREIGLPTGSVRVQSNIPILWEMPTAERPGGFVIFLDGHVEWAPYPGPFPMVPDVIEALRFFMKESGAEYAPLSISPVYELARKINRATADGIHDWRAWDIYTGLRIVRCDISPSVVAGDGRGYRIVLGNSDGKTLPLSHVLTRRYQAHMEFVLFPDKEPAPEVAEIPWTLREGAHRASLRRAYLGDGYGFHWYSNAPSEAEILVKGGVLVKSQREKGGERQ
jgi:hypothetical protein